MSWELVSVEVAGLLNIRLENLGAEVGGRRAVQTDEK
jgi:hypothetical protein